MLPSSCVCVQRAAAESVLKQLQAHQDAWQRVDVILEQSQNPQTEVPGDAGQSSEGVPALGPCAIGTLKNSECRSAAGLVWQYMNPQSDLTTCRSWRR